MAFGSKPPRQEAPGKPQGSGFLRVLVNPATTVVFSIVLMVEGVVFHLMAPQMSPIYIGNPRWADVFSLALDPLALSVMGLAFLAFAFAEKRHPAAPGEIGLVDAFPAIISGFLALLAAILGLSHI